MKQLIPYLNFQGTAKQAMEFYSEALSAELEIQLVKDTPMAAQSPAENLNKVMHAVLTKDGARLLFASDMMHGEAVAGNMVTLCLDCSSEEELRSIFDKLALNGKVGHKLETAFWGAIFGDLVDQFGIRWMFNFDKPKA
jgi:PhnB protein